MSYFTLLKIWDGTNGPAAVKAASTAAIATDPALVVAISPNNVVPTKGALTHNNAAPAATQLGVLPSLANQSPPTLTEGDQVLLSSDLQGSQRTRPGSPISGNWTEAPISFSAAGDNTVIAGVGGKTIRVMRMFFVNGGAVGVTSTAITLKDSASNLFTGAFQLVTAGVYLNKGDGEPYYTTAASAGFVINSSQAVSIAGAIWYTIS
jgi:hypothetical protein